MNIVERRIPTGVLILIAGAIAIGAMIAAISLGAFGSPQAAAEGEPHFDCNGGVVDIGGTQDLVTHDAAPNMIVTGVCIKAGNLALHEFITADQADILGCYTITGIGTPSVKVERTDAEECNGISHIDVIEEVAPTPTPTPTATPPATATPTPTPTPTGAALGVTQEPEALPDTGAAPAGASRSYFPLLLALGGLALVGGAGTLAVAAARRRR